MLGIIVSFYVGLMMGIGITALTSANRIAEEKAELKKKMNEKKEDL